MLMLVMVDTDMDDVVTAVVAEGHFINQHLGKNCIVLCHAVVCGLLCFLLPMYAKCMAFEVGYSKNLLHRE